MGNFIFRQPNGLIGRYSGVVDDVTHINMTENDYIQLCMARAVTEAQDTLQHYIKPFEFAKENLKAHLPEEEYTKLIKQMSEPVVVHDDANCGEDYCEIDFDAIEKENQSDGSV